jgi:hypothetical protein
LAALGTTARQKGARHGGLAGSARLAGAAARRPVKYRGHALKQVWAASAQRRDNAHALAQMPQALKASECHGLSLLSLEHPQQPFGKLLKHQNNWRYSYQ